MTLIDHRQPVAFYRRSPAVEGDESLDHRRRRSGMRPQKPIQSVSIRINQRTVIHDVLFR